MSRTAERDGRPATAPHVRHVGRSGDEGGRDDQAEAPRAEQDCAIADAPVPARGTE